MFRPDREPRGEDPLLLLKMTLFFVAAAIAITGMALQRPWIIFAAIVLLGVAFLLRFRRPRADDSAVGDYAADDPRHDTRPPDGPSA